MIFSPAAGMTKRFCIFPLAAYFLLLAPVILNLPAGRQAYFRISFRITGHFALYFV
jgi:hypothetical protein